MANNNSFKDYIVYDVLGHIDTVTARAMFGGWGIYKNGVIVGIIIDGEFYLKADTASAQQLSTEGRYPFVYSSHKGKTVTMPYMNVTEEEMNDPERMRARVDDAYRISSVKEKP